MAERERELTLQGTLRVDFVHPMLVRFSILYAPITGVGGPNYFHDFIITPDGVLSSLQGGQQHVADTRRLTNPAPGDVVIGRRPVAAHPAGIRRAQQLVHRGPLGVTRFGRHEA